ncbi:MAG: MalY/PatB family protein [Bacillota bacterium]
MYDFDTYIDRSNTGAIKWNRRPAHIKEAGFVPLSVADMEFAVAPPIREALAAAVEHGIYGYTDPDERYYSSVTHWMKKRHAWDAEPEWIVCTGGVVPAILTAIRAFTRPGDGVIFQPPVYYPFASGIRANDRKAIENPLILKDGKYQIDFEDLRAKASDTRTKLLLLCSPHNPVGRVWTREELVTLGDICAENGVLIISDEIHFDVVFPPYRHTVFATLGDSYAQNSIVCTSTNKTFNLAGLTISNIIIQNPAIRRVFKTQLAADGFSNMNYFALPATIAGYTQAEDWFDALLRYIEQNYLLFVEKMAEIAPDVHVFPMEGTYLAWTDWRRLGLTPKQLEDLLLHKAGLALDSGGIFGTGGEGFERFNLAVPQSVLAESLQRLQRAIPGNGTLSTGSQIYSY